MVYISSAFVEFREILQRHVRELESAYPERYSTEWFFLRYARRVRQHALEGVSAKTCAAAMRGFTRFYVDRVDRQSNLANRFEEIIECHRYALRCERPESARGTGP